MSAHKETFGEWLSGLMEMLFYAVVFYAGVIGYCMNIYKLFTESEQGVITVARAIGIIIVFFGAIMGWV